MISDIRYCYTVIWNKCFSLILRVTLQWHDVIFSTYQTVLLVLILAFSHFYYLATIFTVILSTLLLLIFFLNSKIELCKNFLKYQHSSLQYCHSREGIWSKLCDVRFCLQVLALLKCFWGDFARYTVYHVSCNGLKISWYNFQPILPSPGPPLSLPHESFLLQVSNSVDALSLLILLCMLNFSKPCQYKWINWQASREMIWMDWRMWNWSKKWKFSTNRQTGLWSLKLLPVKNNCPTTLRKNRTSHFPSLSLSLKFISHLCLYLVSLSVPMWQRWADQEELSEETPLGSHEKCNTQPQWTRGHDLVECNRKRTSRAETEEPNKGMRGREDRTMYILVWGLS